MPTVTLTRKAQFSAAHFYDRPELSDAENQQLFYACSNRHGHGHNYTAWVTVQGPVDPATGMAVNLKDLKTVLNDVIVTPLDHKNLNHEIAFFKNQIPTVENITGYLWDELQAPLGELGLVLVRLKLVENEDLYAEYLGEAA